MTDPVKPTLKSATEEEVFRLGALVLGLHNALHGRDFTDDGADFADPMAQFKARQAAWLEKAEAEVESRKKPKKGEPGYVAKEDEDAATFKSMTFIAKSVDDDRRLITAVVLRPDEVDLHGDIYDAEAVEKACFDFNVNCRNANLQHVVQVDETTMTFVESWIAKADFDLGGSPVLKGDWLMTMHIPSDDVWKAVKAGDLTGFSVGCVAEVEELE